MQLNEGGLEKARELSERKMDRYDPLRINAFTLFSSLSSLSAISGKNKHAIFRKKSTWNNKTQ